MWGRRKSLVNVDNVLGRLSRYSTRRFDDDTLNRQICTIPKYRHLTLRSLNDHSNWNHRPLANSGICFPLRFILQIDDVRDNRQPFVKRKFHARNVALHEGFHHQGNPYYRLQQRRFSGNSTAEGATGKNKSKANETNSESSGHIPESKSNRSTDPAFASYLTGEIKPQSILSELTKLSATSILNQRRTAAAKRSRSFALDTNNDKELYRQIVDFQILQKEKSYRKTAYNVNRALIGNIVICTGKFCWKSWTKACLISIYSSYPLPHLASFS